MSNQGYNNSIGSTRSSLTVRACIIRDGTQGISLSLGGQVIGEWTDSRAKLLSLTDDFKVQVHGADGEPLYFFSAPGRPLSGEQASNTEVTIFFQG